MAELTATIAAAVAVALANQSGITGQVLSLPEYHGIGSSTSFKACESQTAAPRYGGNSIFILYFDQSISKTDNI
ncbi:hypothetical protein AYI69_g2863 [Smittium culicis]|uniref:Uncharacterized protein n=1 Tax=Smittium culicis TaxID=133412 RepID=A0A1R1YLD7_9FUNG|nr:hypothetical protein AYI69_g2863 [Smittium culicis]